jgi:hypothetical protein
VTDLAQFMAAPVPQRAVMKALGDYITARKALSAAVAAAVYRGATWEDIGAWMGIPAEMAQVRFTSKPKENNGKPR